MSRRHIYTIISTSQFKGRQSSFLEKRDLVLNVLFLYLKSLNAQFSCSKVTATIAQANPEYHVSLQFRKTLPASREEITPGDVFHKNGSEHCQKVGFLCSANKVLMTNFHNCWACSSLQRWCWALNSSEGKNQIRSKTSENSSQSCKHQP